MASDGVTGAADASLPILMTMVGFLAVSLYNVVELLVIIFTTFKQRTGLYFWSFIVATVGIAPHAVGFILKFFSVLPPAAWALPVALVAVGFPAMVTGQSVVLYSRLHLVVRDPHKLRWVLYMIIFDGVVMTVPLIILAFGSNSPNPGPFLAIYTIWDKMQIAVFAVQEIIISVLYIYETSRLLSPAPTSSQGALRKILIHLLIVNAVVLAFDVTLLGVQYSNNYEIQTTYKGAVYSIKLKLEFSVLNQLISVIQNRDISFGNGGHGGRGFSTSGSNSHRLETFTFTSSGKKSIKGPKDYGFAKMPDDERMYAPPAHKNVPGVRTTFFEDRATTDDDEISQVPTPQNSSHLPHQDVGTAISPQEPERSASASQASEAELFMRGTPETSSHILSNAR